MLELNFGDRAVRSQREGCVACPLGVQVADVLFFVVFLFTALLAGRWKQVCAKIVKTWINMVHSFGHQSRNENHYHGYIHPHEWIDNQSPA